MYIYICIYIYINIYIYIIHVWSLDQVYNFSCGLGASIAGEARGWKFQTYKSYSFERSYFPYVSRSLSLSLYFSFSVPLWLFLSLPFSFSFSVSCFYLSLSVSCSFSFFSYSLFYSLLFYSYDDETWTQHIIFEHTHTHTVGPHRAPRAKLKHNHRVHH